MLKRLFGRQRTRAGFQRKPLPTRGQLLGSSRLFDQLFRIVDVETTGLNPQWDGVCEIAYAIVRGDGTIFNSGSTFVHPGKSIPASAEAVHGIRNEDVAGMPTLVEAVYGIPELYEPPLPLVAHGMDFDLGFLSRIRIFVANNSPCICTLQIARDLLPGVHQYDLVSLREALQIVDTHPELPAHRAVDDVAATCQLFNKLLSFHLENGRPDDVDYLGRCYGSSSAATAGRALDSEDLRLGRELIGFALQSRTAGYQPLTGLRVAVTGELRLWSRQETELILEALGAWVTATVSSKTNYLIAGNTAGSKLTKAQQLGIPVLDERGFAELVRCRAREGI